jgi:Rieske Fe-S protein
LAQCSGFTSGVATAGVATGAATAGVTATGAAEAGAAFSSVVAQPVKAKIKGNAANMCDFENFMI